MTYDQLDAAFAARAGTSVYEAAKQSTATELDEALFREAEHGDPPCRAEIACGIGVAYTWGDTSRYPTWRSVMICGRSGPSPS